jgi:hypothetical protein
MSAPSEPRRPSRHRRWLWVVAGTGLVVALLAGGTAVLITRDDAEEATRSDLLERADALLRDAGDGQSDGDGGRSGDGGTGSEGTDPAPDTVPSEPQPGDTPGNPLEDLLGGMGGTPEVDPACLLGEGGTPNLLGGGIEGTVDEQVDQIARLVEKERGLQFDHAIEPELLPAEEFDQRIAETVRAEYPVEQADLDSRVLQLLGAVPRGTDLKALREDLMSGQVAGYYDPETGEVVVRVPEGGGSLDANGQTTLAHELDHALTDQALGLPDIEEAGASDANLARLALVEGDATLLMQRFALQSIGLLDQLGAALGPDAAAAQQDLAGVPAYLRSELMFPYTAGMAYACRLQEDGGWRGVDAAYDRLPSSSAEVLFADRQGFSPADPVDVAALGGTWDEAERDTLGAAELQWLFQAPGGDESLAIEGADSAAHAWAGGELALFTDGEQSALGLALVDDSDTGALCSAVEEWYQAAFEADATESGGATVLDGGGQVGVLRCDGPDVRLGIAPDQATASALAR